MTREEWVKDVVSKQPVFDDKDKAIQAAIQKNKEGNNLCEIWKEPKERGGRFVVAEWKAFEVLYREKYTQEIAYEKLCEIARGEDIDEIEEV